MRWGVISDVHANIEALDAVLAILKDKGAESYICCGDLVGYGPDPAAGSLRPEAQRMRAIPDTGKLEALHIGIDLNRVYEAELDLAPGIQPHRPRAIAAPGTVGHQRPCSEPE